MSKDKTAAKTKVVIDPARPLYLLSALVKEEAALNHLVKLVEGAGAEVKKSESLGVRTLAFPINKRRELTLVSVFFIQEPRGILELEGSLKHDEEIERYILTRWNADVDQPKRGERTRKTEREPVNV